MFRLLIIPSALLLVANAPPADDPRLRILITNDDGIESAGLAALVDAFGDRADIVVSAPAKNNSGASQSVSIVSGKLAVTTLDRGTAEARYAVHGTPADAVLFGLLGPSGSRSFDLVISGINKGENVGSAVTVSGTIGAARQAALLGVPAIAVSQQHVSSGDYDFMVAARITRELVDRLQVLGEGAPRLINLNVPREAKGIRLAPVGGSTFSIGGFAQTGSDAANLASYSVAFSQGGELLPGTDSAGLTEGYATVTALALDQTDYAATLRLGALVAKAIPAVERDPASARLLPEPAVADPR